MGTVIITVTTSVIITDIEIDTIFGIAHVTFVTEMVTLTVTITTIVTGTIIVIVIITDTTTDIITDIVDCNCPSMCVL